MSERKRVLVVDDDPQLRRLLELTLRRAGYEVDSAATGEEGVAKVLSFKPDLVLMDVMMPDMDGSRRPSASAACQKGATSLSCSYRP